MRTLVGFHIGGTGGPQRSLMPVLDLLAQQGPVEVLVPDDGDDATRNAYAQRFAVTALPYAALIRGRSPREVASLAQRLRQEVAMFRRELRARRPDLVVVVTTVLPSLLIAARLQRIRTVVYAAELYDQPWKTTRLPRLSGGVLLRGMLPLCAGVVCCSEAVARQFPRRRQIPVVVSYPGIAAGYAYGDRSVGRARYGLDPAATWIAVVGSISRGRGQDVALQALPLVRASIPEARLLILGSPHPRAVDRAFADEVRTLAGRLGVADAVVFAEAQAHGDAVASMADVYAAVDVVVNPARLSESFGRVAAEALVARTPVVVTRVGAVDEVIRHGLDGRVVEPEDPQALAKAVVATLRDRDGTRRMVATGRARVTERFSEQAGVRAWREVLGPLLVGG